MVGVWLATPSTPCMDQFLSLAHAADPFMCIKGRLCQAILFPDSMHVPQDPCDIASEDIASYSYIVHDSQLL